MMKLKTVRAMRLSALSLALLAAASAASAAAAASAANAANAGQRITQDGDNLWNMSLLVGRDQAKPVQQWMLAVLRRNPDAFVLGNIHRLRSGVSLVLPSEAEVQAENLAEASALIIRHQQGVQGNTPMPALPAGPGMSAVTAAPERGGAPSAPPSSVPSSAPSAAASAVGAGPAPTPAAAPSSETSTRAVASDRAPPQVQQTPGLQQAAPWRRWLPHALALVLAGALAGAIWWVHRRGRQALPEAVSTLFQDTIQLLQGKRRLPSVSTAAADMARSVEKLKSSSSLVRRDADPGSSAMADRMNARADEVAIKLELARAQVELGRKEAARLTLESILGEGNAAQQELARQQLRALRTA